MITLKINMVTTQDYYSLILVVSQSPTRLPSSEGWATP